jgi:DNA-binding beta-propeller fold protein YncE
VLVINAATYAVTATIPVSGVPYLVAVTPDGSKSMFRTTTTAP